MDYDDEDDEDDEIGNPIPLPEEQRKERKEKPTN